MCLISPRKELYVQQLWCSGFCCRFPLGHLLSSGLIFTVPLNYNRESVQNLVLNTQAADRSLVLQGHLFAYLNSCGLRVQLSISLCLGAEILLFWTLTGLSIPSATGSHKNKESYLENHKDVRENQEVGQG